MNKKVIVLCLLILVFMTGCSKNNINLEDDSRKYIVNKKIDKDSDFQTIVGSFIHKKINKDFNIHDYTYTISVSTVDDEDTLIYDFSFMIGNIKTNIGYSVFVVNNKITYIYDNMDNSDINYLKSKKEELNNKVLSLTDKRKEEIKEKALQNNENRTIEEEKLIYIVNEDSLYYEIKILEKDEEINSISVDYYREKL